MLPSFRCCCQRPLAMLPIAVGLRPYSVMGGLRYVDFLPPSDKSKGAPGAGKDGGASGAPKQPDKFYTGRLARWVESGRLTENWDMSKEHGGDLLRAMMIGLTSRHLTQPLERRNRQLFQRIRQAQVYDAAAAERLGTDLAAARCLLSIGCRVAFAGSQDWLGPPERPVKSRKPIHLPLPTHPVPGMAIEAVDARDALLMPDAVDWLGRLRSLRFLRLRRAPFADDSLLARLAARCETLQVLDLSACPHVTWEGVAALWRMKSLRRLVLSENYHLLVTPNGHTSVPAQLEELIPDLFVEGVDDLYRLAVDRAEPGAEGGIYDA